MENQTILVPLTKREFREAKSGTVLEKRCKINDTECCIMIANRFISSEESQHLLESGFNVYPLDISELQWWDLDKKGNHIVAEYDNSIFLCLISQNFYHQLQKERENEQILLCV